MDSYKTFIKNNRTVLIGHILIYAQGIILMPLIIKTVGITVYGGYILVSTLLGFTFGISSFGVGFKSGRFLPASEGRKERRAFFYPQFCFQFLSIVVLSLVIFVFYPMLDRLFFKSTFNFSRWLVFPYLFLYFLFSQIVGYLMSTHRVHHFNFSTVAFPYVNIALVALVYLKTHHLSVNTLFLMQIAAYLLLVIPLLAMLFREIGLEFTLPEFKELVSDIKLGLPLRINYIMDFLLSSSDRYLITYFLTVAAVGYYNPGYALGSLIIFFPRVSGVVLVPLMSKALDTGNKEQAHNMFKYTIKGFLLLAIPYIVGSAVLSRSLLTLFANTEVSQKAYLVTPIVAAATLFFGLNIILSNVLWVKMKTSVILKMNTIAAFINLALNLIFLSLFKNVLIAAITTLISYAVVFVFIRRTLNKDWPLNFEFDVIRKSIIASALMGIVLYGTSTWLETNTSKILFLLSQTLIGIVVYGITLLVLKTFSHKELLYFKKAFN